VIEAGAELIGLNHPRWLHLARHFQLGLMSFSDSADLESQGYDQPMMLNGVRLTKPERIAVEAQADEVYQRISQDAKDIKFPETPWLEGPAVRAQDTVSLGAKFDEWNITGQLRTLLETQFRNDNVADAALQSYLGTLCTVRQGSDDPMAVSFWDTVEVFRCTAGNQALAFKLAQDLPHVLVQCPVKSISQQPDGSFRIGTVPYCDEQVDFVVLATAPTMWPAIRMTTSTGQPPDLRGYIPNVGPATKLLTKTTDRFWLKPELTQYGFSSTLGSCWEATDSQDVTFQDPQQVVLSLFAGSPLYAREPEADMKCQINSLYFGTYFPAGVEAELIRWEHEPFVRTGYSCWFTNTLATFRNLYYPLPQFQNRLVMAGEHTSAPYFGYMEGALASGARSAQQILVVMSQRMNHGDFFCNPFVSGSSSPAFSSTSSCGASTSTSTTTTTTTCSSPSSCAPPSQCHLRSKKHKHKRKHKSS
jgi:monoamine oxidase